MTYRTAIKKILKRIPWVRAEMARIADLHSERVKQQIQIEKSRSPVLMRDDEDHLTEKLLSHPAKVDFSRLMIMSKRPIKLDSQKERVVRILKAYKNSIEFGPYEEWEREPDDLWNGLETNELADLTSVLNSDSPDLLHDFLTDFGNSYTWFGGISTSIDGFNKNLNPSHVALTYFDHLLSLTEACGLLDIENPESGPWGQALAHDVNILVDKLNKHLGFSIIPPMEIIHVDGLHTNGGLLHYRHINALAAAVNVQKMCGGRSSSVCEIGGGSGFTAYYLNKMGLKHTIFDLPLTCVLSSYFILNAVDPKQVGLFGENIINPTIKILPYWTLSEQQNQSFTLAINQDGLPEFPRNLIEQYSKIIREKSQYFLSVNHETFKEKTIKQYFNPTTGYKNVYRYRNWCRAGYVDELFECLPASLTEE